MKKGKVGKKMINSQYIPQQYTPPYSDVFNKVILGEPEHKKTIVTEWRNLEVENILESIFSMLVSDKTFIAEAREARKNLATSPSKFTNLTKKYSHLIE